MPHSPERVREVGPSARRAWPAAPGAYDRKAEDPPRTGCTEWVRQRRKPACQTPRARTHFADTPQGVSCRSRVEPDECADEGDGGEVAVWAFVAAGSNGAPSLEAVEAAFDDVAPPVGGRVEPAGPFAASSASGDLLNASGNRRLDPTPAEASPKSTGRVALASDNVARPGPRPSRARPRHADPADDSSGPGTVVTVAAGDQESQEPATAAADKVEQAGQPPAGASRSAFLKPPSTAACWCAHTIVEPIATSQPTSDRASAAASRRPKVPSTAQRPKRP